LRRKVKCSHTPRKLRPTNFPGNWDATEDDRVDLFQRPLGPLANVVRHPVGDPRDQIEADLRAIDSLCVRLYIAPGGPRQYRAGILSSKPWKRRWRLRTIFGPRAPVPITGPHPSRPPVLRDQRLRGRAVADVPTPLGSSRCGA